MVTVTFEALFLKGEKGESTAFVKRNKSKRKNGEPYDGILLIKDFNNIFLDNAVVVLEESTEQFLGYIDETSAAKLILLKARNISGSILDIKKDDVAIRITAESSQPDNVVKMIEENDSVSIVNSFCPVMSHASFSEKPPTYKQFRYAIDLGIDPRKKSFYSISDAIDSVLEGDVERKGPFPIQNEFRPFVYNVMCKNTPASPEQLETIRELHGKSFRKLSYNEAEEAIDYLSSHTIKCPYCHRKTENLDYCDHCDSSLGLVQIPLIFNKQDEDRANNKHIGCIIVLLVVIFLSICFMVLQPSH